MLTGFLVCGKMRNMNMKQARFTVSMTQSTLSFRTKINQSTLSRIENNTLVPTAEQIKLIAKALKTKHIEYRLVKPS